MKVRVATELATANSPGLGLQGKCLVALEDGGNFEVLEVVIPKDQTIELKSPYSQDLNHIYFCIAGSLRIVMPDGGTLEMTQDSSLALTHKMVVRIMALGDTRLHVSYVKPDKEVEQPEKPNFTKLSDIIGTERDVDWGNGRSRRFLVKGDGFNMSLHLTWVYPERQTSLQYRNHFESAYYVEGEVTYSWDDGKSEEKMDYKDRSVGGTMIVLDQHDAHMVIAGRWEAYAICNFNPPLTGTETHDPNNPNSSY